MRLSSVYKRIYAEGINQPLIIPHYNSVILKNDELLNKQGGAMATSVERVTVRVLELSEQSAEGSSSLVGGVLVYKETDIPLHNTVYGTFFEGRYVLISISKTDPRRQRMFNFKVGERPTPQFIQRSFPRGMDQFDHYLVFGPEGDRNDVPRICQELSITMLAQIYHVQSEQPVHNACLSYDGLTGVFFCMDSRDGVTPEEQLPLPRETADESFQALKQYIADEYARRQGYFLPVGMAELLQKVLKTHDKEELGMVAADEIRNADLFESKAIAEVCDILKDLQFANFTTEQALDQLKAYSAQHPPQH